MLVESISIKAPVRSRSIFQEGLERTFNRSILKLEKPRQSLLPGTSYAVLFLLSQPDYSEDPLKRGLQTSGVILKSALVTQGIIVPVILDACFSIPGRLLCCTTAAVLERIKQK